MLVREPLVRCFDQCAIAFYRCSVWESCCVCFAVISFQCANAADLGLF